MHKARCTVRLSVGIVIVLSILCGNLFAVGGDMGSGNGSQTTPYLIEDYPDFLEFTDFTHAATYWASGIYTRLDSDLDLDPVVTGLPAYTTAPIGPVYNSFSGNFDGNGHIISNLTINESGNPQRTLQMVKQAIAAASAR